MPSLQEPEKRPGADQTRSDHTTASARRSFDHLASQQTLAELISPTLSAYPDNWQLHVATAVLDSHPQFSPPQRLSILLDFYIQAVRTPEDLMRMRGTLMEQFNLTDRQLNDYFALTFRSAMPPAQLLGTQATLRQSLRLGNWVRQNTNNLVGQPMQEVIARIPVEILSGSDVNALLPVVMVGLTRAQALTPKKTLSQVDGPSLAAESDQSLLSIVQRLAQEDGMYDQIAEAALLHIDLSSPNEIFGGEQIQKAARALRTLEYGMINLSLDQKVALFFTYLHDREAATLPPALQERYQRFLQYIVRVEALETEFPMLLFGTTFTHGARYTERDFWVEQQIMSNITSTPQLPDTALAARIPAELVMSDRTNIDMFRDYVVPRLRRLGLLQFDLQELSKANKMAQLRGYLTVETDDQGHQYYFRSQTVEDIATAIDSGAPYVAGLLREISARDGLEIRHPDWREGMTPETAALRAVIEAEVLPTFKAQGRRWMYREFSYEDITAAVLASPNCPAFIREPGANAFIIVKSGIDRQMRDLLPPLTEETERAQLVRDIQATLQQMTPPRSLRDERIFALLTATERSNREANLLIEAIIDTLHLKHEGTANPMGKAKYKTRHTLEDITYAGIIAILDARDHEQANVTG